MNAALTTAGERIDEQRNMLPIDAAGASLTQLSGLRRQKFCDEYSQKQLKQLPRLDAPHLQALVPLTSRLAGDLHMAPAIRVQAALAAIPPPVTHSAGAVRPIRVVARSSKLLRQTLHRFYCRRPAAWHRPVYSVVNFGPHGLTANQSAVLLIGQHAGHPPTDRCLVSRRLP